MMAAADSRSGDLVRWRLAWVWRRLRHGWCRHRDPVRVHRDGIWSFECACGYLVPMVERSARERARCRRLIDGA